MKTVQTKKKIQKLMIDKDVSGAMIARRIGCTRQNIYHVIRGRHATPNIRQAIAEALGVPISDLWPAKKPRRRAP
ncbi:MAG TPA: helix-turn-helix transcriptional regulator [Syntrophorhabdaceae bacterium]|nr:helix-turn-helix transcriptional regulator [Syntrophorhabdaceae bacterium]